MRDYTEQMALIAEVAQLFPVAARNISLHAGELALPLVPPGAMRSHIYEAVHIAGASRIGHGVDIIYEDDAMDLLQYMAEKRILVEINLTSNAVILGVEGAEHPFELYRSAGVPLALSTDDEGVARIDLTHEYLRAATTYELDYAYLKELSRNALAYSFLSGQGLFDDIPRAKMVKACARNKAGKAPSADCRTFLDGSEKARMQWDLEERFREFEARYN
jgi:adenosine deaminase